MNIMKYKPENHYNIFANQYNWPPKCFQYYIHWFYTKGWLIWLVSFFLLYGWSGRRVQLLKKCLSLLRVTRKGRDQLLAQGSEGMQLSFHEFEAEFYRQSQHLSISCKWSWTSTSSLSKFTTKCQLSSSLELDNGMKRSRMCTSENSLS